MPITIALRAFLSLVLVLFVTFFAATTMAEPDQGRFFIMGSGVMQLKNLRNNREATVHLLQADGSFNEADFNTVDWVFGFPTSRKGEHISPRLLFMLSYFAERLAPGKAINIESGYRSPEYNDKIRAMGNNAARTSTHMDGMALDFWLEGVEGKKLWETIKARNCGGIGHYGGKTVHFDAGRPRFWEAATSGTRSKEPDENRHLYLSTDYDRYAPAGKVRLALSSLSSFQFGVLPIIEVFRSGNRQQRIAALPLDQTDESACLMIGTRKASRFMTATLPQGLTAGRYQLKLSFCNRPFARMPEEIFSNPIEIHRNQPIRENLTEGVSDSSKNQ
ncbi:MAG: YcbK family protein [Desulfobulbus sp.]